MSFKFDPSAGSERKYINKPGTYDVTVKAYKQGYLPPNAKFYVKFTFETSEGEAVFGDIFIQADKNGGHERLNQFVASTAVEAEIKRYLDMGDVEVTEDFLMAIAERSVGRRLKVVVTERKYTKNDGSEGVAYQGSFFRRNPQGPEQPF